MSDRLYAIMGATGHIGQVLATELLKRGNKVRAIDRNEDKLNALKALGAETAFVDFDKADALSSVFIGAKAVYSFIPPGYFANDFGVYQDNVGDAIVDAIKIAKTKYVLNISSIGANLDSKTGPILSYYKQEKRLETLTDVNIVHLRPSYFMENLQWSIPFIKSTGNNGSALRSDLPFPFVATNDIGIKAAEILDKLDFQGHSIFELTGPRELTMQEATSIFGRALGKPDLKYVQLSYEDVRNSMVSEGMFSIMADLMVDMYKAFNSEAIQFTQKITPEHRGPTTIEEFAKVFAKTYQYID